MTIKNANPAVDSNKSGDSRVNAILVASAREKLLVTALELFGQYGFEGVSTRKLAERAGVNLQAINYYFVNKRGLYNAVADYVVECLRTSARQGRQDLRHAGRPDVQHGGICARSAMPELGEILPEAFASRVKRLGMVNAMDDEAFAAAVKATGRKKLILAGVTNDVCTVYPALGLVGQGVDV